MANHSNATAQLPLQYKQARNTVAGCLLLLIHWQHYDQMLAMVWSVLLAQIAA